tara:strand:- start:644 stop:1531 length:888 start_codon:yes stop_codon:yes gene_type:complete
MRNKKGRLFCFGLGYCALALLNVLRDAGWQIAGTCRSEESVSTLTKKGIEAYVFDGTTPMCPLPSAFLDASHVLCSAAPTAGIDPVLAHHAIELGQLKKLAWVGYLSTTGVYGDWRGDWVDENSELRTMNERGIYRIKAENEWLKLWEQFGVPVHIFRLAGIYGPGRNAIETVRTGRARRIKKRGQVFSRIHVDDISQVLAASISMPHPSRVYNVCDNEAAPPQDVISYACYLLGVEPPPIVPFEEADLSSMARSFYTENKRVSNLRMSKELGVQLKWPDYRAGLKSLLSLSKMS